MSTGTAGGLLSPTGALVFGRARPRPPGHLRGARATAGAPTGRRHGPGPRTHVVRRPRHPGAAVTGTPPTPYGWARFDDLRSRTAIRGPAPGPDPGGRTPRRGCRRLRALWRADPGAAARSGGEAAVDRRPDVRSAQGHPTWTAAEHADDVGLIRERIISSPPGWPDAVLGSAALGAVSIEARSRCGSARPGPSVLGDRARLHMAARLQTPPNPARAPRRNPPRPVPADLHRDLPSPADRRSAPTSWRGALHRPWARRRPVKSNP
jgi:hypothetical protein